MRYLICCMLAVATIAPAQAQTLPSVPSLPAGPEFKGLRFDWEPAAGASWYELEYKSGQNAGFTQLGADLPGSATSFRYRFPLHLFDWTFARYRLAACNTSGCTRTAEVSVSGLRRAAVGYFKASDSLAGANFGRETDLSPDGLNMVAAAPGDPDQAFPHDGGAIYVFRRAATRGEWTQRARLMPTAPVDIKGGSNEMNVAISADGNTVVLGMPNYLRQFLDDEVVDDVSGEVFVFGFDGASWLRTRLYSGSRGAFGHWVGIDDAGDTVAVASGESVGSRPNHVFIYRRSGSSWQPVRDIRATVPTAHCPHGAFSRDGSTVVETCWEGVASAPPTRRFVRIHSGPNWTVREELPLVMTPDAGRYQSVAIAVDATGETIAANLSVNHSPDSDMGPSQVHVFRRDGSWSRVAELTTGSWRDPDQSNFYGGAVSVSGDGGTIAVGDARDNGLGTGPRAAPLNPGDDGTGAIYVYRLRNGWRLANVLKPNYVGTAPYTAFGLDVSLNGNGQTLIVGHSGESSDATGIGGGWANADAGGSGAVWMY